jgi:hypothetical protein
MSYTITTKKTWSATMQELAIEFERWGIPSRDWDTNYPRGARLEGFRQSEEDRTVTLRYTKESKEVVLSMGTQARAVDNLRVLYLAIESMRLNEKRGIGQILESAYLQLAGPVQEKSPWEVLGIYPGSPLAIAETAYKIKAKEVHPDHGGSQEEMRQVNSAIEKIRSGKV